RQCHLQHYVSRYRSAGTPVWLEPDRRRVWWCPGVQQPRAWLQRTDPDRRALLYAGVYPAKDEHEGADQNSDRIEPRRSLALAVFGETNSSQRPIMTLTRNACRVTVALQSGPERRSRMSIGGTTIPPHLLSRVATGFDSVSAGIGTASSAGGDPAVQDALQSFQFASSLDNVMGDGSVRIADGSVFPSPGPFLEKSQEFRAGKFDPYDYQFEDVSHHLQDLSFDITDGLGTFSQNLFGGGGLAQNLSDVMLNPQPLPPGPPDPDGIRSDMVTKVADDLNPQPLPPGPPPDPDGVKFDLRDLFAAVALNPQPLPPGPPDPEVTPLYLTDLLSQVERFAE